MIFYTSELPIVFLSYDEPNYKINLEQLKSLYPNVTHVHGIKGSDTAHKKAIESIDNSHVIIVDGDNYVKENIISREIELKDDVDIDSSVISYSAYNIINGCSYGNGGIKIWPTNLIRTMRTHENDNNNSIDFDFKNYLQLNINASEIHINKSKLQAWRSGFREGIKLCMENNQIVEDINKINWRNYDRLWRWMHVGSDVDNGLWGIYGARLGCYLSLALRHDYKLINDFDELNYMFNQFSKLYMNSLRDECNRLGNLLRIKMNDRRIGKVLTDEESYNYRKNIPSILRSPETFLKYTVNKKYDIFDGNEVTLYDACLQAKTDYFYMVYNNTDYEFNHQIEFYGPEQVHEINENIKLYPRMATIHEFRQHPIR